MGGGRRLGGQLGSSGWRCVWLGGWWLGWRCELVGGGLESNCARSGKTRDWPNSCEREALGNQKGVVASYIHILGG